MKVGYRHVDSAVAYRNEGPSATGMKNSAIPREQLFFTSKVSPRSMSYEAAVQCIDETLQKTGFEYIDLYLLHAPYGGKKGRLGAWKALVEAVEAGKIRSIGVSNYGVHHLEELEQYIKSEEASKGSGKGGVLSINQLELHPWLARQDIADWCKARGVLLEVSSKQHSHLLNRLMDTKAYCPIVRGQRMGEPVLTSLAKKHSKTPAQILLRWSLQMVSDSDILMFINLTSLGIHPIAEIRDPV